MVDLLYMSHLAMIMHIGLTPTINSFVISISELSAIPLAVLIVPHFPRIKLSGFVLGLCVLASLATGFIKVPGDCHGSD